MRQQKAGHTIGNRWIRVFLGVFLALTLSSGCREEPWDPEVAVVVNDRPIKKAAVDRVLEWGFYPDLGQPGEREATISLILDKLIDEKLILAEAEKAGLTVDNQELNQVQSSLGSAWFDASPPPAELGELRDALRNQMILRKMTEQIMVERRVLSADEWRAFWAGWPKNKPSRFLVRVLLLPPAEETPTRAAKQRQNLEEVADQYKLEGLAAIISGPLWLSGEMFDQNGLSALEDGLAKKQLTGPIRLAESWAIYEVLEIQPAPGPAEEFQAAQAAFENLAGEKAFQEWLNELRNRADIKINPALNG